MKQKNFIVNLCKILVVLVIFALSTLLFFNQATAMPGVYLSDLQDHIAFATKGESYSVLYFAMGLLLNLTGGNVLSVAVLEAFLVVATGWVTYLLLLKLVPEKKNLTFFVAFALLFLTSVYVPMIHPYYYRLTFVTQPWHNITYIGMRFFALLTMYAFAEAYEDYLNGLSLKHWCMIAIPLFLATAIKPNFLLSFSFALLTILIIDFVKNFFDKEKFLNMIKMGTVVFPACGALLVQAVILYGPNEAGEAESSVFIVWATNFLQHGFDGLVFKILCGLTFPIVIYVLGRKALNRTDKFVYLMYLITFIQVHMLAESGIRAAHGNFTWGIYNSAYILFVYAIGYFINHYSIKEKNTRVIAVLGWGLLAMHLASGLLYFLLLLVGGPSYLL